jgi:PKD repeat protein
MLLSVGTPAVAASHEKAMEKLHWWVLDHTKDGAKAEFFIIMKDQADVSQADQLQTKFEKGWFVYRTLTEKAETTQKPIRDILDARGVKYRVYFIVNAVFVEGGTRELALDLAQREDVDRIEGNPVVQNLLPTGESAEDPAPGNPAACDDGSRSPESVLGVEWGVAKVNAPAVWALGFRGEGVVVGGQDTGYRWTHTFIKNQYRGWDGTTADHNYNWHDAVHSGGAGGTCAGPNSPAPCDDHGHGTHTMSTVLGDDGGANQTGVAPHAKWIGCRNMELGAGTPATYLECFEFFLAPTMLNGSNPDPSKAPDLTTNSWGCPTSEGCSWTTLQTAVDNQKAAGIMTVVSAGNEGSSCNTVTDPPAMYLSSYTVGSTTSSDTMSDFSSRGVGAGNGAMKPDIVAPGSEIRGANNTSDTATMTISGTSMAAPHVAGCVALLWNARPCLDRQVTASATQLDVSATRLPSIVEGCGGNYVTGPNNTWGYGLVNALAAVSSISCCTPPGVPSIGTATVPGDNQITVSWTPGTPVGATYKIYRAAGTPECPALGYTLVKSGQAASPWTDTTVSGGTTYSYKVKAVESAGGCESALSGCAFAIATGPCTVNCTATVPATGIVGVPVAFSGSATTLCTGTRVYAWTFGDGTSSTLQNPSHAYGAPGNFTWGLTVTVAGQTCARGGSISIAAPCSLTCGASASPSSGIAPLAVNFSGSGSPTACSSTSVSYAWAFGDGETSLQKNSAHEYTSAGVYTWTMTATSNGLTCAKTGTVTVTAPCTVSCAATASPSTGPIPFTVAFSATATASDCTGGASFLWSFGDGASSTSKSPSHEYVSAGSHTWTMTATVDGKSCTKTGAITANEPCAVACEAWATPAAGVAPLTVAFLATAMPSNCAGSVSYLWDFGDGTAATEQNPGHSYASAGSYTWTLTATADGKSCTHTGTVAAAEPCTLTCEASAFPAAGAAPLTVAFSASATPSYCSGGASFLWAFGDGTSSTEQNPGHMYTTPGSYSWTLTVSTDGKTCARAGAIVVAEPCALACEASATPAAGVAPLTVAFSATATPSHCAGAVSFLWAFGDGTLSSEQNPGHSYASAGSYGWTLTATAEGKSCTGNGTVTVNPGVPGDADGDGVISIGEIQQAVNMFLGLQPPGNGVDCGGDGTVSIGEVQKVINAFLGVATSC